MTLITAIVAGLACGYWLVARRNALAVFLAIWLAVLTFQTFVALHPADVPPEDWAYVPVQAVILAVGIGMVWLGSKARARFERPVRSD